MGKLVAAPRTAGTPQANARRVLAAVTGVALAFMWLVAIPSPAKADGPTTFSNTAAIAIPASGSANQTGPASPYPSPITVSGMTGAVTTVTVTLVGVTHPTLGDIDALVVAPTGENLMVLSDAGAVNSFVSASNATLTFSDAAAAQIPTTPGASIPTGPYRPTNGGIGADTMPAPAPAPSTDTTLAEAFTGINPNGAWRLFVNDDATGDLGQMAGGWSLTITTETAAVTTLTTVATSASPSTTGSSVQFTATVTAGGAPVGSGSVQFSADGANFGAAIPLTPSGTAALPTAALTEGTHLIRATYSGATGFLTSSGTVTQRVDNATVVTGNTFCNPGVITVPQQGSATPYPSNIRVSGLTGQVTKVVASLKGLSHQTPFDLDVLLSGPTPTTNLFLLSDAGGPDATSNLTLNFDDAAASTVPIPPASGTYRPTRVADESNDAMPSPAPTPSSATTLATFNGATGNGTWSLWVVDDASGDSGSISGGWCLTITSQVPTSTTLTASPNPSSFGDEVTFTATVTSAGSPATAGSVQFSDGAAALGAAVPVAADGTATLRTAALAAGTHTIQAAYGGTGTLAASTDDLDQVVQRRASVTALASSVNPSAVGDQVTFTATVTVAGAPVATGSVTFSVDGADQVPVPLTAAGAATLSTSGLSAGTHTIGAAFSGNATDATSQDDLDQTVEKLVSTTVVTSAPNPSTFGQSVTFTATVTSGGAPVTSGTVQFRDGATPIGPAVPVAADGTAALAANALGAGSHTIGADFSGTAEIGSSTGTVDQVIAKASSATVVVSDTNPSTFGQSVIFTATVTASGPLTDGSVTFTDGATMLCDDVDVDAAGTATCATDVLGGGSHTVTATFAATADLDGSAGTVSQTVSAAASVTTVTTSGSPSALGDAVTFTATVRSGADPVAGVVEFSVDGGAPSAPLDLAADGTAAWTTRDLVGGGHVITAHFTGTADHSMSSGSVAQQVTASAVAGGPYTVAEGASLALDGSGSSPGASYAWDVNDDGDFTDVTGQSPTLTWAQLEALGINDGPSDFRVTLQVRSGAVTELATSTLSVTNTAPTAVITGGLTATVGIPFTIKVGADDPSSADLAAQFSYTIDWGDGSPIQTVSGPADPPVTHTYASQGDFAASFLATDKDGGESGPTAVTVQAAPAVVPPPSTPTPTPTSPTAEPTDEPTDANDSEAPTDQATSSPSATDDSLASTGAGPGLQVAAVGAALLLLGLAASAVTRRRGLHE